MVRTLMLKFSGSIYCDWAYEWNVIKWYLKGHLEGLSSNQYNWTSNCFFVETNLNIYIHIFMCAYCFKFGPQWIFSVSFMLYHSDMHKNQTLCLKCFLQVFKNLDGKCSLALYRVKINSNILYVLLFITWYGLLQRTPQSRVTQRATSSTPQFFHSKIRTLSVISARIRRYWKRTSVLWE